ncbi:glycosyltransferase [bacterium]|nr:glycosyltransferase [bacterium]
MMQTLNIILLIATAYVALGVFYVAFFAFVSVFYKEKRLRETDKFARIAVFIPGYKEDIIICDVARDALNQQYCGHYDVVVIADSFSEETLVQLRQMPIVLKEVSFEKSTKAKSLNTVMAALEETYDLAVVLDADNLMAPGFLKKVNAAYQNGYTAMQGHRTAKNTDTAFARLDAMSEEINNSIFRRGHWHLGLPSALIGSAMAFEYQMYKQVMSEIDVVSGFDKELEVQLIKRGIKVAFLNDAVVLDEKVQNAAIFEKQRTRWLAAQVNFALKYFGEGLRNFISTGSPVLFDKALQFALLPRALTMAALLGLTVVGWLLHLPAVLQLNLLFSLVFVLAMMLAIPRQFYSLQMLGTLAYMPGAVLNMMASLLKINRAKNSFIHTPHTHVNHKTKGS